MRRRYALLSVALLYLGSACMQDPEAPHNQPDPPTLSVDETSVTRVSMLVNGSFGHDLTDITSYGVELSTTLFESGGEVQTLTPQEVGPDGYALGISGLSPNETYYLRAFISNGHSKMYSSVITQKTPETSVASVSDVTLSADGTYMTATLEDNGGRSVEEVGFVWGSTNDRRSLRREKRYPATIGQDGRFSLPLSLLGPGTHYLLAYAEDNKEATGFSRIALEKIVEEEVQPAGQPSNEIWYTSTDGEVVEPSSEYAEEWGATLLSNRYENGKGIISFNGPISAIATSAFRNCATLETVTLAGTSISAINWGGFLSCSNLKSISLPASLKILGGCALEGTAISSIELPSTLEYIDHDVFNSCTKLEEITIPESVTYISPTRVFGDRTPIKAFYGKGATADHACLIMDDCLVGIANKDQELDFVIPDGVKSLGTELFDYWCYYKSITFPSSLQLSSESMGFLSSPQRLTAFYGDFVSEDKRCLIVNGEMLGFACYNLGSSSYTVPAGVRVMGKASMYNQNNYELKTLILPEGVESVKDSFIGLTSIESVELPSSLKEIDDKAFFAAYDLKRLTVPASVESIGSLAFQAAGYEARRLSARPSSLQIEPRADDANGMTDITFLSATPPAIQPDTFDQMVYDCPLYVPASAVDTYKSATNWSKYADRIMAAPEEISPSRYLTFSSKGRTTLMLNGTNGNAPVLYYSYDKITWSQWDYTDLVFTESNPLYICGDNPDGFSFSEMVYSCFFLGEGNGDDCSVSGDVMSLLNKDMELTVIPNDYCFYRLFSSCPQLISPPRLDATELTMSCYKYMFSGCTSLINAPELPATTLARDCYSYMFYDCTSLQTAPELPATELAFGCYRYMFGSCSALTTAPQLPATVLAAECYSYMFSSCSSLTAAPELPADRLTELCYASMFKECTNLVKAPELPATSMEPHCYSEMFSKCSNLSIAPELPAMTLSESCYANMFSVCTSLINAPELLATQMEPSCYFGMFWGCTSLINAPELPAEKLASGCYGYMFKDCPKINYIKCLAKILTNNGWSNTSEWLNGVSAAGTFVKAPDMQNWPTGTSGIPEGWTVENADGTVPISPSKYLTFTSEGTTTISLAYGVNKIDPVVYYSTDAQNWMQWDYSELTFSNDKPLYMCGDNPDGFNAIRYNSLFIRTFNASGDSFAVSGDIMSLIDFNNDLTTLPVAGCFYELFKGCTLLTGAPALPATKLTDSCYLGLFNGCSSLKTAPELPATELTQLCYREMFCQCRSLETAPRLPATTLTDSCYYEMFSGCSSLSEAPELPAMQLAESCYSTMFAQCTSLVTTPQLPATTLTPGCYLGMFSGCSRLTEVTSLPATELTNSCYLRMFNECTSLKTAPALPATSLAESCYERMFSSCHSLESIPEILPATTLKEKCYASMFSYCYNITTAPILPATTLVDGCYLSLFTECSKLSYVKCLATDISAYYCNSYWLDHVASTGVFVKAPEMQEWVADGSSDGIPKGWVIISDGETPGGGNEGTGEEPWN